MAGEVIYVDVQEGSKRVVNNTKLYAKLLGKFKDDQSIKQLETALSGGDMTGAKEHAHTLKGLAANLSLIELFNKCLEIETQIKSESVESGQFDIIKNVYDQTIIEVDKVIAQYA
jgi:HPt (histidine-containing phosphotransfer) domain-containing protein